jgi:purine-binding chemotaxis protein CheW
MVEDAVQALLVVEMGGRLCGFLCEEVLEVLPRVAVTPVPDMPAEVLGVINARGKVVPVVDPRQRLGGEVAAPGFHYFVLLEGPTGPVAVAVDRVRDVVQVAAKDIAYPAEKRRRLGVVRLGGELVVTMGAGDVYREPA